MALLWKCPSSFLPSLLQSHNHSTIPKPLILKTLTPNNSSSPSISVLPSNCHRSLQRVCSGSTTTATNSSSSVETESNISPSNGVFIKGLPESATEGRLKKVFSQFGEVYQVKFVVEKKSMQPIGSAFVWFTSKESVQLAVEKMNGKFFDGRFILVKIAEPGLSNSRGKRTRYRF